MNLNDPPDMDQPTPLDGDDLTQETTMPLGVGDLNEDAGFDVLASTGRRRKLSSGSLVLIAVVVCAVGGLFSMRFLAHATAAMSSETEFEKVIDDFFGDKKSDKKDKKGNEAPDEAALEVLNETYTEHQVPLANVVKNPFIVFAPAVDPVAPAEDENDRLTAERQRKWREQRDLYQKRVEAAADRLTVKTILLGSDPLANMGGTIVHVGDTVVTTPDQYVFKVTRINSDSVELALMAGEFDVTYQHTVLLDGNL